MKTSASDIAAIGKVCAEHYGAYVGHGKWSPPNRCDSCPLRAPCFKRGATPAHSLDDMAAARDMFHREAADLINARASGKEPQPERIERCAYCNDSRGDHEHEGEPVCASCFDKIYDDDDREFLRGAEIDRRIDERRGK